MTGRPLSERVRVERRAELLSVGEARTWEQTSESWDEIAGDFDPSDDEPGDGYGNKARGFVRIGPAKALRAEIRELSGDEQIEAAKTQGVGTCLVVLRSSQFTRTIRTDDRIVVLGEIERILNVRHVAPPGRGLYISLKCEDGVAT